MKIIGNLEVVKTQHVECDVTASDILALVRQHVHIPEGANVRVYVDIPGGGDWSNMELDIAYRPVRVKAVWSVEDVPNEQG